MTNSLLNVGLGLSATAAGDALEPLHDRGVFLVDYIAIEFPRPFQQRLLFLILKIFLGRDEKPLILLGDSAGWLPPVSW